MFKNIKRRITKSFRELLVYHHDSLEYRAKILTLIVSADGKTCACEEEKLQIVASMIYPDDPDRASFLLDTVKEYHLKIITNNGLDFEHLIQQVIKDTKSIKRFSKKIDMELLQIFDACVNEEDEEEVYYRKHLLAFLKELKEEHSQEEAS